MRITNSSGQVVVESLVTGLLTILALSFTLMLFYRGLVYFGARHCVNDLLFCLASMETEKTCRERFDKRASAFLIFKDRSQLQVRRSRRQIVAVYKVKAPGTPALKVERKIQLPLTRNL